METFVWISEPDHGVQKLMQCFLTSGPSLNFSFKAATQFVLVVHPDEGRQCFLCASVYLPRSQCAFDPPFIYSVD